MLGEVDHFPNETHVGGSRSLSQSDTFGGREVDHFPNQTHVGGREVDHFPNQTHVGEREVDHFPNQTHVGGREVDHFPNQTHVGGREADHFPNQTHVGGREVDHFLNQTHVGGREVDHFPNQTHVGGINIKYDCTHSYLVVQHSCHAVSLSQPPVCVSSVSQDALDAGTALPETHSHCALSLFPSQTESETTFKVHDFNRALCS